MSEPEQHTTGAWASGHGLTSQATPPTFGWASPSSCPLVMACASFRPNLANAMPARPTPNFFSAARRVTDWARLLVSSSNWLFILFPSFLWLLIELVAHSSSHL